MKTVIVNRVINNVLNRLTVLKVQYSVSFKHRKNGVVYSIRLPEVYADKLTLWLGTRD